MKTSKKIKIWGLLQFLIGVILIIIGSVSYDKSFPDIWAPNLPFFLPGTFLVVLSIPLLFIGFIPEITKLFAKLQSETIDHAGSNIKESISKQSSTVIPAITPSVKEAVHDIKKNKESRLEEAKSLLDKKLITKQEYEEMRKKILDI